MPYIMKKIADVKNKKAYEVLLNYGFSMSKSQKFIDKSRLICNQNLVKNKNEILNGEIFLIDYKCEPKNLKPVFENENFAIFDKPSGILSHPNGRNSKYNLYDEIWSRYDKQACVAHRLDKETSGLIAVSLNPKSAKILKQIFENRQVKKSYLAFCEGVILNDFIADFKIAKSKTDDIRLKMEISEFGKNAITIFKPLKYFVKTSEILEILYQNLDQNFDIYEIFNNKNFCEIFLKFKNNGEKFLQNFMENFSDEICEISKKSLENPLIKNLKFKFSLVNCKPKTGRQHQIRLHLFHMKHRIVGDPLYGVSSEISQKIIDEKLSIFERKNLTGSSRLLLHAQNLEFEFLEENFRFESKTDFEKEILNAVKN